MNKKKVALVTGGVGGIGTAICQSLAQDGHRVIANYVVPDSQISWLQTMHAAGFSDVGVAFGDVGDFDAMATMVKQIETDIGPVDILVNCAGITRDSQFRKMTKQQWDAVINVNLNSAFNVTRHVIDGMIERGGGRVINISSVNGSKGQFGQTNYSAAKAGLHGFTKALAQEVIRYGVTVNSVSPGYVGTDLVMAIREDVREKIIDQIPAGRLALPEEIGAMVAYLASDKAAFITGANMAVNGGQHMF
jgi:acetoacetyl-CoA reductase